MKRFVLLIPPAVLLLACGLLPLSSARAIGTAIDSKKIGDLIAASGAQSVAVAYYDLGSGETFLIRPDEDFHAASTMKVPVMMEVFRQAHARKLPLDAPVPVTTEFASIVDGSRYQLTVDSDDERTLYEKAGQTASYRELVRLMITLSSNLATNILIDRVGAPSVMKLMREIGANRIRVLRGVEDIKAYERGLNNTTTARDLMIILRRIAERRAVSPEASDEMIRILLDQKWNESIPAGLPKEVRVAHKTGDITGVHHDAAIVYPPASKPYILVILTRGIEDPARAHKLMADISREVFRSVNREP